MAEQDISIHDLPNGVLTEDSLFAMAYPISGGYASGKIPASVLGKGLGEEVEFASLQTGNKTMFGAINELATASYGKVLTATLTAGQTTVTFTDSDIKEDSLIDVYSDPVLNIVSDQSSAGSYAVTFEAQSSDVSIAIVIRGYREDTIASNTFGDNYTVNYPSGTITQIMVCVYHDGFGLWNAINYGDHEDYLLVWTGTPPYYDSVQKKMIRTGGCYYAVITSLKGIKGNLRTQPKTTISLSYAGSPSSASDVVEADDLGSYCIANLTDILDENGNVVLASNHSLSDFGVI